MKKFLLLFITLLLSPVSAHAENDTMLPQTSLFFTPDETRLAEALAEKNAPDVADIRLGAVMYYGPHDWTLWLQGIKWTPSTSRDDLKILYVAPNEVRLSWRGDDGKAPRQIVLRPNEAYEIATGKIIVGP